MRLYVDTCALLNNCSNLFEDYSGYEIMIPDIVLQELEHIKTSKTKDEQIRYEARMALHLLEDNRLHWKCGRRISKLKLLFSRSKFLPKNNDSEIIKIILSDKKKSLFLTDDLSCQLLAESMGINVINSRINYIYNDYKGYIIDYQSEDEMSEFYSYYLPNNENFLNLYDNQYLLVADYCSGKIVDKYKWHNNKYHKVNFNKLESKMFGKISPMDDLQQCAIDSFQSNQITMVRGAAGTGKSFLGLGFLFTQLEKGVIDKIIIFCNPVATRDSCKLGFYPGDKNTKLLDSQIGNFLIGKLGDMYIVEDMIEKGTLVLVPVADCRGMDISGMHAGVYFSEAQNSTVDMMKLMLQRVGDDSIVVIEGDDKCQIDMSSYGGSNNGLRRLSEVFKGEPYYGEITLKDCHRGRIAKKADEM